jgi:hypothetical protein
MNSNSASGNKIRNFFISFYLIEFAAYLAHLWSQFQRGKTWSPLLDKFLKYIFGFSSYFHWYKEHIITIRDATVGEKMFVQCTVPCTRLLQILLRKCTSVLISYWNNSTLFFPGTVKISQFRRTRRSNIISFSCREGDNNPWLVAILARWDTLSTDIFES